jgi:hypothetical protein
VKEKDLNELNTFFLGPQIKPVQKEHIKELVLEKLADKKSFLESENKNKRLKKYGSGICKAFKSLWWRWHWKLSIPVVVLLFIAFIGSQLSPRLSFPDSAGRMANNNEITNYQYSASDESGIPFADTPSTAVAEKSDISKVSSAISLPPDSMFPPADPSLPKMITYNLNANIQVSNVTETLNKLNQDIQQLGGYVTNSQLYYRDSNEYGHFTAKIPADKFDNFRLSIPDMGKILSLNQTANDITNQYYDAQTRLLNWEAEQARFLEIIKQAKTIEEIIKVEGSLANIRQQIEQLKGQLKFWNNAVQYSTVQIELQPVTAPVFNVTDPWQPVSWAKTWKAVQGAVLKTLSVTWNAVNYIVVVLAYTLPFAALLGMIYVFYRFFKKIKGIMQTRN